MCVLAGAGAWLVLFVTVRVVRRVTFLGGLWLGALAGAGAWAGARRVGRWTVQWPRAAAVSWVSLWWVVQVTAGLPWWTGLVVVAGMGVLVFVVERRRVPAPAAAAAVVVDERVAMWRQIADGPRSRTHVQPDGTVVVEQLPPSGFLPGSRVDDVVEDVTAAGGRMVGFRLRVSGNGPRQHAGVIEAARPQIAAMYGTRLDGVHVVVDGDHSWCWVKVLYSWYLDELDAQRQERQRGQEHPCWDPQGTTTAQRYGATGRLSK